MLQAERTLTMKWTDEQLAALDVSQDQDLILSASAGSGKTTVLIARVLRLILERQVSISNILMITFTNKSARDMRRKLKEKLEEARDPEGGEYPGGAKGLTGSRLSEALAFLERQSELADGADIRTIDSFCLKIVRSHARLLDLDTDLSLLDEVMTKRLQEETLQELLEKEYGKADPRFISLRDAYGEALGDRGLRQSLIQIYNFSRSNEDPEVWLDNALEMYRKGAQGFRRGPGGTFLMERYLPLKILPLIEEWERLLREVGELAQQGSPGYQELWQEDYTQLQDFQAILQQGDPVSIFSHGEFHHPRMTDKISRKEQSPGIHESFKKLRGQLKKHKTLLRNALSLQVSQGLEDMLREVPVMEYLISLVKSFGDSLIARKRRLGAFDFNDITHFTLALFQEHPEVLRAYQEYYRYVFFDEFQDTNRAQEKIFRLLAREGGLFFVGDKKQSIYRFRLADSSIFDGTIREFQEHPDRDSLLLNRNFRSSPGVINSVNSLFQRLMEGHVSSVCYSEEARLVHGSPSQQRTDPGELWLLHGAADEESGEDDEGEDQDALEGYKKEQSAYQEALVCAKRIRRLVDEEGCRYRDFAIISYSVKGSVETFREVFDCYHIPIYGEGDAGFLTSLSVSYLMDYLAIIDNRHQDLPLLHILKSFRYGFTLEELALIRKGTPRGESLWDSLKKRLSEASLEERTLHKIRFFQEELESMKNEAENSNLPDFIIKLLFETQYYYSIFRKPDADQEDLNMKEVLRLAMEYEKNNAGHIRGFLEYVRQIEKLEVRVPVSSMLAEDADVVRMVTIHKSKGLEYPNVFLTGLGKKFSSRSQQRISLHRLLGLGGQKAEPKKAPHLSKTLIKMAEQFENLEDQLNLLYVAMTRAEDRLFLVGYVKDLEKSLGRWKEAPILPLSDRTSFLDLILPEYFHDKEVYQAFQLNIQGLEEIRALPAKVLTESKVKVQQGEITRLQQPFPKKLSASDYLRTRNLEEALSRDLMKSELRTVPAFLEDQPLNRAQIGTLFHLVMEILPFDRNYREEEIREYLRSLLQQGILKESEYDVLDIRGIISFVKSPMYQRILGARRLEKEQPFTLLADPRGIFPDFQGDQKLMVQGIMDLFFVEEDGAVLVDYKTDKATREELPEKSKEYSRQLALYRKALEEICRIPVKETYLYFSRLGEFYRWDGIVEEEA